MSDARTITEALGGKWRATGGMAKCPIHDDRTPSLSIKVGVVQPVVVNCFAGCKGEDILAELHRRGLLDGPSGGETSRRREVHAPEHKPDPDAVASWRAGEPAAGTVVEKHLIRDRCINLIPP